MPVTEQQVPADVALRVELLPASFGDCILVTAPYGRSTYRLLVDTGPDRTSLRALRERLEQIPLTAGKRRIDLLIVTHIDHDHIGNVDALLNDRDLHLHFGDIWFNGHEQLREFAQRGTVEADAVSATIARRGLPLNRAFSSGPVVVPSTEPDTVARRRGRERSADPDSAVPWRHPARRPADPNGTTRSDDWPPASPTAMPSWAIGVTAARPRGRRST